MADQEKEVLEEAKESCCCGTQAGKDGCGGNEPQGCCCGDEPQGGGCCGDSEPQGGGCCCGGNETQSGCCCGADKAQEGGCCCDETEEDACCCEDDGSDGTPEGKVSRFAKKLSGKRAKQDKKEEAAREKISQLEDRVKRQLAEFENFRNRTEKEKQMMFETGAKSVIEKMLPVVDNFERGLATVPEDRKEDPFVDGMNRIYRQLLTELENMGVKPIEAVGCEFDPRLHNAVMQVESGEFASGVIAQELQKGYIYRDSVVRHSMVAVVT